ncbi:MAG: NADH-quinone oxidoreductase subunit L [Akkermansiaceae bacterium]
MILWLLFILPLASAALIHFVLKQKFAGLAAKIGTISTLASLVIAILWLSNVFTTPPSWSWINVGAFEANIGLVGDQLAKGMMIVVCGIGFLVHMFSLAYMEDDEAKARYFGNLSLFMFSMTGIVLAENFIMMFIFWELVGLSSYLLIGHWYKKDTAADAAKKAFLSNRIGDFGFLIGILMTWIMAGSVVFSEMDGAAFISQGACGPCLAGIAVLLVFCGAIGKSAQLPLHVWLPDAMEGPTPVSALIHAATMVAAGVYMMARFFGSIGLEALAQVPAVEVIAWIGAITSLVAALMATQQNDIKKILAYSTLSQLGYMVMAVGLLEPNAGMFHLYTHAWFKALLFLGSGAVIYACHHEQDIWKMGGLRKRMPITSFTFIIGTLALTAVPMTSGFFSKEGILHVAHENNIALFYIALGVAALTTFYMFRLIFVAFLGEAKDEHAKHAKEVEFRMFGPLALLALLALGSQYITAIIPKAVGYTPGTTPHFDDPLFYCSVGAFAVGLALAFVLYKGKTEDPISIPLFRNKFYIDEFYAGIVKWFQDILAAIVHFLDEFIINGMIVGGLTRIAQGTGNLFRKYGQSGNLQHYALISGVGVIIAIYFTVFSK